MDHPSDLWGHAELHAALAQAEADRAEAGRLVSEARAIHCEADFTRARARKLAARFARRLAHQHAETRRELGRRSAELADDVARLNAARGEFHASAAEARDRLRDAWAAVEEQRRRATEEWAEADRYFTEQTAVLDARSADLASREKDVGERLAHAEAEVAGLREEAAALDRRVQNARTTLADLEARRDRARAELLHTDLPDEPPGSPARDDLPHRELLLAREKAAVAALRSNLERESADLDDARRLVAEQLAQLADARARWQVAERQTVAEMEELARALRHREHDADAREHRLIAADARRRDDAHALWRFRLSLESWQSRLTAFEARVQAECGDREAHLARRAAALARREVAVAAILSRWEQARTADHARLRAELGRWEQARTRAQQAAADYDRRRQDLVAEAAGYAARAMAAEELVARAVQDSGSDRAARRLRILRKRWERVFEQKAKEAEARRAEAEAARTVAEQRLRELRKQFDALLAREAEVGDRKMTEDRTALAAAVGPTPADRTAPSAEVAALRAEVERLAAAVLELEYPELPEPELPWAIDDPAAVPSFTPGTQAA